MQLQNLAGYILLAVQVVVLVAAVYAVVHAAMQRSDAYTAVGKMTKPIWLGILAGAVVFCLLGNYLLGVLGIAIAACAVGVYLVDVRPKILEVQGKSR